MVDFCESYSPFHVCLTIRPFAHLVYTTSHLCLVTFYMTSCVHKMCKQTYGQTNMKRAITLAKSNHPWNRYNMRMLRSWPIKIPNMNKMRQKTNIIPISRMVDFCESYSPFHVCLTIRPFAHLVYATSHLSFVAFYWTDRRTRVFQHTHHSVNGGIMSKLKYHKSDIFFTTEEIDLLSCLIHRYAYSNYKNFQGKCTLKSNIL
jgi:hypothetical protein